ncbi:MAG: class IV adenylate cyclase [Candidatus Micrarchaeota archaeon]
MQQEFETRVLDVDVKQVTARLRELGAQESPEALQKRWVFDIECLDAQKPGTGEWVRLRQVNGKSTLTYKNRRGNGISETSEIEVNVADFDKTAEILSRLTCFTGKYLQENKRKKFILNNIEFTLDTWPMIPTFLEVEAESKEKVRHGLKLLGLEGKDSEHIGTIGIYAKYGIDLHSFKELKF